jgi:hypothetical protein
MIEWHTAFDHTVAFLVEVVPLVAIDGAVVCEKVKTTHFLELGSD